MKKALAILISLILVFAVAGAAFADQTSTITISNAVDGETYTAYKIFDATYQGTNSTPGTDPGAPDPDPRHFHTAYSYTITNNPSAADWFDFLTSGLTADANGVYNNTTYGLTFTPTSSDPNTYVVEQTTMNDTQAAALAAALKTELDRAAAAAAATPPVANPYTEAGHAVGASGTATINVNPDVDGYYFVTTTLGSLCALDTTEPTARISEKNTTSTATKQVNEDQTSTYGDKNDAEFGETVNYKTTVVIGAHQKNVVLEDRLYNGLKLCPASGITVKVNDVALDPANYTLIRNSDTSFSIAFDTAYTEALAADTTVVVEYSAEVLTTAVLDVPSPDAKGNGNDNETWVTYGAAQESTHDWTRTYVWTFPIFKYTEGDTQYAAQSTYVDAEAAAAAGFVQNTSADATSETYWMKTPKNPLADAHFSLFRSGDTTNPVQFVQVSAGDASNPTVYRLATAAEIADNNVTKVTDLVTPASGLITIQGVDSEQFILRETAAPAGYNKLADDITVEIVAIESAANQGDTNNGAQANVVTKTLKENNATADQIEVLNNTGNELPSTGGIGTTIFYVLGGLLVAGAVIVLIVRKRMAEQC
ncbi:MAG: LPXTG cell wall anchor domain-containing protein [Oscillospiraceae bacterium]|nr:LPXTG cell wall anchor domain-containing protein [Oscillospiraceae bacterium]